MKFETTSINVNGNSIGRAEYIKYLGTNLEEKLRMKCNTAMFNLFTIKNI